MSPDFSPLCEERNRILALIQSIPVSERVFFNCSLEDQEDYEEFEETVLYGQDCNSRDIKNETAARRDEGCELCGVLLAGIDGVARKFQWCLIREKEHEICELKYRTISDSGLDANQMTIYGGHTSFNIRITGRMGSLPPIARLGETDDLLRGLLSGISLGYSGRA